MPFRKPGFGELLGHGEFGIRSNLRTFKDLLDQSGSGRQVIAQVQPVLELDSTAWSLSAGAVYVQPFEFNYGYFRRDVVGMSAIGDVDLTRGETTTLNAGEYYYDPNQSYDTEVYKWDQADARWQISAWTFDGSSDYMTISEGAGWNQLPIANGKEMFISFWMKKSSLPSGNEYIISSKNQKFAAYIGTDGNAYIIGKNAAGATILNLKTAVNVCDGTWHHIMASCNLADTDADIYLDGTVKTTTTATNDTIDFTDSPWGIGADPDNSGHYEGDMGQLWFINDIPVNPKTGGDEGCDDSDIRDWFYNSTLSLPADIPADGILYLTKPPFGAAAKTVNSYKPLIWLFEQKGFNTVTQDAVNAGLNNGRGGNFGDQGTITEATTRPTNNVAAETWDQFPQVYIRLSDGSNPADTTSVVHLGFHFASKAQSHPALGPELLGNGNMETWTGGVGAWDLGSWTEVGAQLAQETTDPWAGTYSASFAGGADYIYQDISSPVNGGMYRLCGYYKTTATLDPATEYFGIKIKDSADALSVDNDGRSNAANVIVACTNTAGEWRFFCFDYIWNGDLLTNNMRVELHGVGLDAGENVYFDDISLKRIWRYEFYEPKITASSIPAVSSGSAGIYFGGKRTSVGSVGFINQDAFWEPIAGQLEWINQKCKIYAGGNFLTEPLTASNTYGYAEGQEILFNDMRQAFTGLIQNIKVTDSAATLGLQDIRAHFHIKLPKNVFDDATFADLDAANWQGKVRPMLFGAKRNITPARIGYEVTNSKYGNYEIADCTDAPNGIKEIDNVYAYVNKEAADRVDTTAVARLKLVSGTDYTKDLANGRFTIDADVGPYLVTAGENDIIDFEDFGTTTRACTLDAGLYTAATLVAEVQAEMRAETADTINVSYSETTNKFTIQNDAGNFKLLLKTGAGKERSAYSLLGFTGDADKSAAATYSSDTVTFTSADTDHIIRCNAQGYKDDASGTYTGTNAALIQKGADICRCLLLAFMDRNANEIDTTAFAAGRDASESLAMYLNESTSSKDIFESLEFSNIANIIVDGDGKVHYNVYLGSNPSVTPVTIHDYEIQNFEAEKGYSDIYQTIRVLYDQDPTTGKYRAREAQDTSVGVRLGRRDVKEFKTYLRYSDNANDAAKRLLSQAKQAARRLKMGVLGGILIDHKVGDKIFVERARALGAAGSLAGESFRILNIKKDFIRGKVDVDCTDDLTSLAPKVCINTCQLYCKLDCQLDCQRDCQTGCQIRCETGCQHGCQSLCQLECQAACQLDCQTGCQQNCQVGCETVCQACEGTTCQTNCELACQTGCQIICQTVCQTGGCQADCQANCQGPCQINCKTGCEIDCQACGQDSGPCQTSCELEPCQANCQVWCQDSCQTVSCETPDESIDI
jgi:hypothetical protein